VNKKRVSYALDPNIVDRLKKVSDKTMIAQAKIIEKALDEALKKYEENIK
jgi:hypothetical protein